MFGTIADQITAQPHVQGEIARIQILGHYRYNSFPMPMAAPSSKKIWFRRVLWVQERDKHIASSQAGFQSLPE